jgi:hypothetical protein
VRIVALLSLLLVTAAAAPRGPAAAAQATQPPPPRFRTGVDLVEVAVLVKDREGKPVTDLARNEITVLENRAPQTMVAFERVSLPARVTVTVRGGGGISFQLPVSSSQFSVASAFAARLDWQLVTGNW